MRYIGNKTKLLEFIGSVLDTLRIRRARALDPFAGTASVAQYLKSRGLAVASCDIMTYSYVLQRAYVQLDHVPDFAGVHAADNDLRRAVQTAEFQAELEARFARTNGTAPPLAGPEGDGLRRVLLYLDTYLPEMTSLFAKEYSGDEEGGSGRMFFTRANGRRIDAIRTRIEEWTREGLLTDDERRVLLAALLEAADAVANTTGVYAAFVKSWQPNARKPLRLRVPALLTGTGLACSAHQGDANEFVKTAGPADVVYLDPPYNTRQYTSYYHVPELIAKGWFDAWPELRGKTGLIPDADKRSRWSRRGECVEALYELIRDVDARYVLLSYNNEGIIPREAVEAVAKEFGVKGSLTPHEKEYARYRADSDHEARVYKADRVTEYIFSFERKRARPRARVTR